MLKIIKGRRTGKTTELIKISEKTQAYILVANRKYSYKYGSKYSISSNNRGLYEKSFK